MYDPSKPYKTDIQKLIRKTWDNPYVKVEPGIYPVLIKKNKTFEVDHTDGIGTKGYYHWQAGTYKEAVIDALAMNLNDLALMQAVPYKIQNHLTLPKDDHSAIVEIIKSLVAECLKYKIAITGGETSVHDNTDSLDISISMSGVVKKPKPNKFEQGDVLIGLPSSGLHSNGFSRVRSVFGEEQRAEFTKPTKIYIKEVLKLGEKINIQGLMHITGGAFTKLKDLISGTDAIIDRPLKPQLIFHELYDKGTNDGDMYKTFNCGTGFVIGVKPKDVDIALSFIKGSIIGEVIKGSGKVVVSSAFSKAQVKY